MLCLDLAQFILHLSLRTGCYGTEREFTLHKNTIGFGRRALHKVARFTEYFKSRTLDLRLKVFLDDLPKLPYQRRTMYHYFASGEDTWHLSLGLCTPEPRPHPLTS